METSKKVIITALLVTGILILTIVLTVTRERPAVSVGVPPTTDLRVMPTIESDKTFLPYQECHVEGDFRVQNNCSIEICREGQFHLYKGSAQSVGFQKLLRKECVYVVYEGKSWTEARKGCQDDGGDLYAAGDFEGMADFLQGLFPRGTLWVGLRDRGWIDGRHVSGWRSEGPGYRGYRSRGSCGSFHCSSKSPEKNPCRESFYSLCHKGVHYD